MSASRYMARALRLARSAQGLSNPNPPVGAVIVRAEQIVGEGRTQAAGADHAEIVALKQAGLAARDAEMYVTLEPCRHYGRTPPCTDAIIEAAISRVHIAESDPNPLASGGARALEEAGISVHWGDGSELAEDLYRAHRKHSMTGVPWVIAKFAASLDGRIATSTGDSRWITGPRARDEAHRLRSRVDAVMVGAGTISVDDPLLTARPGGKLWPRQPTRVIVGGAERVKPDAQVFHQTGDSMLLTAAALPEEAAAQFEALGVRTAILEGDERRVDVKEALRHVGRLGLTSVLVEGGSDLLGSLFDAELVDEVYAFLAPRVIGGRHALTAVGGVGVSVVADSLHLQHVRVKRLAKDILIHDLISREG